MYALIAGITLGPMGIKKWNEYVICRHFFLQSTLNHYLAPYLLTDRETGENFRLTSDHMTYGVICATMHCHKLPLQHNAFHRFAIGATLCIECRSNLKSKESILHSHQMSTHGHGHRKMLPVTWNYAGVFAGNSVSS